MPGAMPFDIHFADDDLRRLVRAVRRAGGHYLAPCGRERHRPAPPPDHPREYPEWVVGWGSGPVRLSNKNSVPQRPRSEEHTSELQSLMRNSYAVFCLKNKQNKKTQTTM